MSHVHVWGRGIAGPGFACTICHVRYGSRDRAETHTADHLLGETSEGIAQRLAKLSIGSTHAALLREAARRLSAPATPFRPGDRVRHPVYGEGRVSNTLGARIDVTLDCGATYALRAVDVEPISVRPEAVSLSVACDLAEEVNRLRGRVVQLLNANNAEVERRREATRRVEELEKALEPFAATIKHGPWLIHTEDYIAAARAMPNATPTSSPGANEDPRRSASE